MLSEYFMLSDKKKFHALKLLVSSNETNRFKA